MAVILKRMNMHFPTTQNRMFSFTVQYFIRAYFKKTNFKYNLHEKHLIKIILLYVMTPHLKRLNGDRMQLIIIM